MNQGHAEVRTPGGHSRQAGGWSLAVLPFVLIPVLTLAAILAYEYQTYLLIGRRADGRDALLELAGRQERYFALQQRYASDLRDLGYAEVQHQSVATPQGYYRLVVTAADEYAFSLAAEPQGDQMGDAGCGALTFESEGLARGARGPSAAACW